MIAVRIQAQAFRGVFRFQAANLSAGSATRDLRAPGWRLRLAAFLKGWF